MEILAGVVSVIGDNPKNDIYYSTGGAPAASVSSCCFIMLWWTDTRSFSLK